MSLRKVEILSLPIVPREKNERTQKAFPPSTDSGGFAAGVTLLSLGLGWIAIGQIDSHRSSTRTRSYHRIVFAINRS